MKRRSCAESQVTKGASAYRQRGFILNLVLALTFPASLLLSRMASHSLRLTSEAAREVQRVQVPGLAVAVRAVPVDETVFGVVAGWAGAP